MNLEKPLFGSGMIITLELRLLLELEIVFFCGGWDLKAASEGEAIDADFGPGGFAGLTELWDLNKPVIAAVNGLAVGGGFELALAADLIIASTSAEFFVPEATLGLIPDSGGVLRLPRRLPKPVAMDMLMTGRRMGVEEAKHYGPVSYTHLRAHET